MKKVIHFLSRRWNGAWCPNVSDGQNPWDAFAHFVLFELAYGGQIKEIAEEKIVVQTGIPSGYDITTFSGSKEDMRPLVVVAGCYLMIMRHGGDQIIDQTAEALNIMSGGNGIKPLFATMMSGILVGGQAAKTALLVSMNVEDKMLAKDLAMRKIEDLTVYAHTCLETGMPAQEVLAQFN